MSMKQKKRTKSHVLQNTFKYKHLFLMQNTLRVVYQIQIRKTEVNLYELGWFSGQGLD